MIRGSLSLRHAEAFCSIKNLVSRIPFGSRGWTESSSLRHPSPHHFLTGIRPGHRISVVFFLSGWSRRRQPRLADTIRPDLMPRPDASLAEDLLRESPASRKLKFLNGSSHRVSRGHVCSRSINTRLSSVTGFALFVRLANERSGGSSIDDPCCPLESVFPWNRPRFVSVTIGDDAGGYVHTSDQFPLAEPDRNEGREGEPFNMYDCVPRICKDVTYLSYAHVPA